ncbi:DUF2892 domain-containing protein [Roseiarcaceae bacterium H3SJ34-1]|uniref:YgaP family membrane protein n=1 Tax=Terripilifer ovatus TaxID=3032367 RepID=UPI003AB99B51|nr:DUF2892 domain-containing protein [Roseiarcaceae bacterium H3SJ34-1]
MLYVKNVPGWERAIRIILGIGLLGASVAFFGSTMSGWAAGIIGAMAAMSGLLGFCPACAMVGRKLSS